jgi:hypothetical protein
MIGSMPADNSPVSEPYSSQYMRVMTFLKKSHQIRDQWSVAVILLEILCGTTLVVAHHTYHKVEELFKFINEFLDSNTREVMGSLLFNDPEVDLNQFVNVTLVENPKIIPEAIRAISAASQDCVVLSQFVTDSKKYCERNKAYLENVFKIKQK